MRSKSRVRRLTAGAAVALGCIALLNAPAPDASAAPCPDVEVVFARGSGEPPGVGGIGGAFVEALRSDIGARSLGVYAVNYPASTDFGSSDFPLTVIDGIRDAGAHIQSMAATCPNTREVLGGYSQGAAVAGYVTSATIPPGVPAAAVPQPLAPEIANHVAAVTLFGTPSPEFLSQYGAPQIAIGPLYQPKTIQLCADGDNICAGGGTTPTFAHTLYATNGMTGQAADFAAGRL
ncbi:cutinase family protein [Mycobacterium asiaticum]|uniref:Cutinase n=1 Tax=Mycobacterium asiaticum TaxID=1790 RepID=A0A1A3KIL2_MYCAS|nr:cutinase family protein [Mycobacterium asiaticum]OBJ57181.1 cutinase [Mycobacterium asiaticum]OBJ84243.1 cutinase [Mycobacterium asiaticum]